MAPAGMSGVEGTPPLTGRVAVVVGASRGIGKGIAVELALAGAHVVAAGRTLEPTSGPSGSLAETIATVVELGGSAEAVRCDATDDDAVEALFEGVRADHGRLDVLVNAAFDTPGFRSTIDVPFWELPVSVWRDVFDLGTRSMYVACAHATPLMLAGDGGTIVNISARGAGRYRYNVAYGVGKAAVDRMTSDMAHELRDRGVAVVSVWPGTTRTEHIDAMHARGDRWAAVNAANAEAMETPRYVGRGIAALVADPGVMNRSGHRYWAAELAADYGVTDEFGRTHPIPEP